MKPTPKTAREVLQDARDRYDYLRDLMGKLEAALARAETEGKRCLRCLEKGYVVTAPEYAADAARCARRAQHLATKLEYWMQTD